MATYDYSSLAKTAAKLMDQFGTTGCRFLRPAAYTSDPDKPWKGEPTSVETVVIADATVLPYSASHLQIGSPKVDRAFGTLTLKEAGMALMCGGGELVQVGDYLEMPSASGGTDRLMVKAVAPVNPGGTAIIWQLGLGD